MMVTGENDMKDIHTIFGAGQVGTKLARVLAEQGYRVRLVRRSAPGEPIEGVEWMQGDATDAAFADEACRGAASVYNCTNPRDYHGWEGVLEPLFTAILEAAARAGARLVVLDNLYMYGRPEQTPFDEHTPMKPCSDKGRMRARLVAELWAAHKRGEVRVTTGRASDYFGPDSPNAAIFHGRFFDQLRKGAAVELMGNPELRHSYSYTPDVARGLAILGTHDEAIGRAWHLPVSAQISTRELVERFAHAAGREPKMRVIPKWALRLLGVFVPMVGAVAEMLYQWEVPFVLDDGAFRRVFGVGPTPLDQAIAETLQSELNNPAAAA
jgi:nucleoside-diphosphate-sugar epimerase